MTSRQRTWRTCALAAALILLLGASGETQQRPDEPLRGSDPGTEARPARPVRPAVPPAGRTRRQRPPTILSAAAATGTEYVTFWSGDLRIFAREPGTSVELTDIDTGLPLSLADTRIIGTNVASNPFTLFAAADSFEGIGGLGGPFDEIRVRIEASDPVIVWTGSLNPDTRHPRTAPDETGANPWASYIPAFSDVAQTNGREVGRDFLGFTTRRLVIIARKDAATPTSIIVDDRITNTDPDDDDDHVLSAADAVYADAEIEVFWLDGFEDDTVRVTSNVDATVMAGYGITVESDWTTTPPSYAAGDDGIELGTLFYAFVHRSLTVFPTQDDTHVTITDLSDGDDSTAVTFAEGDLVGDYEFYTPTLDSRLPLGNLVPRLAGPAVTVHDNAGNPFDDDIVKVESDKPVLVYVGPIASDPFDYADVGFSVPTGPDSQVIY